ncbi:hypothetical protein N7462_000085 [Penicillium macrosclerotiorum]|uniref:uncharacterized protein n=1 Tax=Penicillium macrosclerotiorum TaxID=303699 RepID=UPI002549BF4D|nr:uncharacterized protein N7462_000085 [Penicillium macrosclerotiorum]KAJ5698080.1 hypothetical protein N7462_000085 [Penicillium macrosclerotiorum]
MEKHPDSHWKASLMGWDFWKDATQYEEDLSKETDSALDLNLHKRFPFNLGVEETPTKRRRRLSMPDTKEPADIRRNASLTTGASRFRDLSRHARSPSPLKMVASVFPVSAQTSAPVTPQTTRFGMRSPSKHPEIPRSTTVEAAEISASPSPSSRHVRIPSFDIATLAKPLINFRGGSAWADLPRNKTALGLDLFWPSPPDQDRDRNRDRDQTRLPCLDIQEMKPLCQFRCLRALKIVGMLQSYQTYIWQTAWVNLNLDELELGMTLEPEITSAEHTSKWQFIQEGWEMDQKHSAEPALRHTQTRNGPASANRRHRSGHRGDGELHPAIGCGEYLDKHCIEKAKIRAMATGRASKRLSIRQLSLSGFVVDADPFLHWFDAQKLRSIQFKGTCVDAGFWLPQAMGRVAVRSPREIEVEAVPVGMVSLDMQKDLKVMHIRDGMAVDESSFTNASGSNDIV